MPGDPSENQKTQLQQQVLDELKNISRLYELAQGQISALRVALATSFRFAQTNAAFQTQVRSDLEARLALMKQDKLDLAEVDGFESVLNELLGNSVSVHQPKGPTH